MKSCRTVAYLRVSTENQDNDKNKSEILLFAHKKELGNVEFTEEKISGKVTWKERKIYNLLQSLNAGDNLIVSELSRLGRSMLECMEILSVAMQKKVSIYAIKGDWVLNDSLQSKIVAMAFSMASEIERDLISSRIKEALKAKKESGKILGRPKGTYSSKLDQYRPEIEALLKNGSTKKFIANRYGTTQGNLIRWLKCQNP